MVKRVDQHILQVENSIICITLAAKDDLSVLKKACLLHVLIECGVLVGGGEIEKPDKLALITYFVKS